jgi:peptide/nickel transport system ATP-binding protein
MAGSGTAHLRDSDDVLLRVEHLVVEFRQRRGRIVHAVSDVSFDVLRGETLGLVGESGCGKSSTGRAVIQLPAPTAGSVRLGGVELTGLTGRELRRRRTKLQMIFQDPISSLNPRRKVKDIVAEGLDIWEIDDRAARTAKVEETLLAVGLDPAQVGERRPRQFSGGQAQRICIARALAVEPEVLICDEPVSALDVSVQAQILNLLDDMKARYGLTMIFVAHDLAVIKNISDRVAVMYLGKLCEVAPADALWDRPTHHYTRALLASIPEPDPDIPVPEDQLAGDLPSPIHPPTGCRFRTRCPRAEARCAAEEPVLREIGPDHVVACHFPVGAPEAPAASAAPAPASAGA